MLEDALFFSFAAVLLIQLIYYGFVFLKFSFKEYTIPTAKNIPVSVIICAKNEADNLRLNLPSIIHQDYASFEIVLIDDNSSDETLEVMEEFAQQHSNIKIVKVKPIDKFWGNKKYALTLGIKAASHNFLLFTDADCKVQSNQWIKLMSAHFSKSKSIVLGYGAYEKKKNSFLNKLIRFETLLTAVQYFSYANLGTPYMGVGRNLAYRKDTFFEVSGFMSHMHIKSGDDDLFVNQAANSHNVAVCNSLESFTYSQPKKNLKSWLKQKRRHVSTAKFYKAKHKFALGLFFITQLLYWILAIVLLILSYKFYWVLGMIFIRFLFQYISLTKSANKLDEKDLRPWFAILDLCLIYIQLVIFTNNLISKPNHWS